MITFGLVGDLARLALQQEKYRIENERSNAQFAFNAELARLYGMSFMGVIDLPADAVRVVKDVPMLGDES